MIEIIGSTGEVDAGDYYIIDEVMMMTVTLIVIMVICWQLWRWWILTSALPTSLSSLEIVCSLGNNTNACATFTVQLWYISFPHSQAISEYIDTELLERHIIHEFLQDITTFSCQSKPLKHHVIDNLLHYTPNSLRIIFVRT